MESRPDNPPETVESIRVMLGACLTLLDALRLHQAAAYVDMALHQTGVPPAPIGYDEAETLLNGAGKARRAG